MKTTTLYYKEGSSDKVYQASIVPQNGLFLVNFAYGRRGSTLNTGSKTTRPVTLQEAETIFEKLIREKKAKGYTEGADGTPYAHDSEAKEYSGVQPQLLNPIGEDQLDQYIASNQWVMQEKFDGKRLLLLKRGNSVRGINRKGLFCGVPEPIVMSASEIKGDVLLDGECVGDNYHVFDLLELHGDNLRQLPYCERLMHLINAVKRSENVNLATNFTTEREKRRFIESSKEIQREGVVFKRIDAPYMAGRPNSGGTQLKCKFYSTASFIVAAVNKQRSLLLSLVQNGKHIPAGNVTVPPNQNTPRVGEIVEVRYLYAFKESGSVYQPTLLGTREDLEYEDCTMDQLKFKASAEDEDAELAP